MRAVLKRRRLEAKTDYHARVSLLKSVKPRLVIRKTNRYIIAQFVESKLAQDKIILGVTSKDLLQKGWPKENAGSLKSRAAAYLTGVMLAKKAAGKIKEAIFDLGLQRNVKKSRIYSALKGVIDGGVKIPCTEESLPSQESIDLNEKVGSLINKLISKL